MSRPHNDPGDIVSHGFENPPREHEEPLAVCEKCNEEFELEDMGSIDGLCRGCAPYPMPRGRG